MTYAAKNANIEVRKGIVEFLLKNGADINTKDNFGHTALMNSAMSCDKEMVKILLKNDANVNAKSNNGKTALIFAHYQCKKDIGKMLIRNGADVKSLIKYIFLDLIVKTLKYAFDYMGL